ncbi:hypothetical protein AB7239_19625 [Providencia alcalifaciens]
MERLSTYGGVRGLGLSGSIAFGLAATMGLLGYIFFYWGVNSKKISRAGLIFLFIICFIASLSAGRTSFLGFLLGFAFSYLPKIRIISTFKSILILIIIISLLTLFITSTTEFDSVINTYSNYAFQPIYNYLETGSFSVSSTEILQRMYFLPSDTLTILFGDGRYTNADHSYYMNTDAGYMRFLLYFGLLGSIVPYIGFIYICMYLSKINKNNKLFFLGVLILSFIYHYKGEIILFNVSFMKIIFIIGFFDILAAKNKVLKYQQ